VIFNKFSEFIISLILDDQAVIDRILKHIVNGTTDEADEVWREPVDNYTSEHRLERERVEILRRWPIVYCPSSALPENNSYLARTVAGIPLLAVRSKDSSIKVFRNACRHRGMKIAEGSGRKNVFVCNYHGWAYRNDGSLSHIPHETGFPNLDKSCHGLVEVEAREQDGLIYVVQEPSEGCWDALQNIPRQLSSDQQIFSESEYVVDANWKLFAESSLEGYHIKSTHKDTFYPYGYDNLTLAETFGRNGRIVFPFKRIEKLAELPVEQRKLDGRVTHVTNLFPNVIIGVLSHFTSVVILEPVSVDKTRVKTWTLTNRGKLDSEQALQDAQRDLEFNAIGLQEDRDVVEAIQKGIASNANTHFTFGKFEKLIGHLHRNIKDLLLKRDSAE